MRVILSALIMILVGGAGTFWQFRWYGSDLLSDWQIRTLQVVDAKGVNTSSIKGECSSRKFISDCKIEFTDSAKVKHAVAYQIAFAGSNNTVTVMQTADQPTRYTTDLGLENFWNRVFTTGALTALFVGLALVGIAALFKRKKEEE